MLTEAPEGLIAVVYPKDNLIHTNDGSQKTTGHLYESISFSGSVNMHAGDIGESKHGNERSKKHRYKKIKAKDGRAVFGNAYTDDYVDKFFGKKTWSDGWESRKRGCLGRVWRE